MHFDYIVTHDDIPIKYIKINDVYSMNRIGYIGSKHKLSDWIFEEIAKRTDKSFISFADIFAGSCAVTDAALSHGYSTISNDLEMYSHVIARGLQCQYSDQISTIIDRLNDVEPMSGFMTEMYSPSGNRMYFTTENAMKIDAIRAEIEKYKNEEYYYFLLASLITSADSVKNTSVIMGAFLKQFKKTAEKILILKPIHERQSNTKLKCYCKDAAQLKVNADIVYIDPPYNARQYGGNYFILNQIINPIPGKGITGVCEYNKSNFCRKNAVMESFNELLSSITARLIVISYSSESLISKEDMMKLLSAFGDIEVVEKIHKRFKAKQMDSNPTIYEYLFFVRQRQQ